MLHKKHVIKLFNDGYLRFADAEFYAKRGYIFVCNDGKLVDMVMDTEFLLD